MMRKPYLFLAFLMIALLLAGCSGELPVTGTEPAQVTQPTEDPRIPITVWASQEDMNDQTSWIPAMCQAFLEENPQWDIRIRYGVCEAEDIARYGAGESETPADVFLFSANQLELLQTAGMLAPLSADAAAAMKEEVFPLAVSAVTAGDGRVYGFPYCMEAPLLYYDKHVFSESDTQCLDTMLESGRVYLDLSDPLLLTSFYSAAGGSFRPDEIQLGSDAGAAATDYLARLAANRNLESGRADHGVDRLLNGGVGAVIAGPDYASCISAVLGENYGVSRLPSILLQGSAVPLPSLVKIGAIGVNPNSSQPEIAMALAEYLSGGPSQRSNLEKHFAIPTNLSVMEDAALGANPAVQAERSALDGAIPFPGVLNESRLQLLNEMGAAIAEQRVTAANAGDAADKLWQNLNR